MVNEGGDSFARLLLQSRRSNELVLQLGLDDRTLGVILRLFFWEYVETLDQAQHGELLHPKTLGAAKDPAIYYGLFGQISRASALHLPVSQLNIGPCLLEEACTSNNSFLSAHTFQGDLIVLGCVVSVGTEISIDE